MKKIEFEDATIIEEAYVIINDKKYYVVPAQTSGGTDLDKETFKELQDNIEEEVNKVTKNIYFATYGTTSYEEVISAYNEGNFIIVNRPDNKYAYVLCRFDDATGTFHFISCYTSIIYRINLSSSGWTAASTSLAPLSSPIFTGTPQAPTATAGTNTTQIATTAFVQTAVNNAVGDALGGSY